MLTGLIVFTVATAAAGVVDAVGPMVAVRIVAGISAAMIMPVTLMTLRSVPNSIEATPAPSDPVGAAAGPSAMAALVSADGGYPMVLPGLMVVGLGMGLTMPPSTEAITASLPRDRQGVASALNDLTREVLVFLALRTPRMPSPPTRATTPGDQERRGGRRLGSAR